MKNFIGVLPQPLKSLYISAFIGLIVNMVAVAFRAVELARLGTGSLGIVLLLIGLCAVTNFRGAARGLVDGVKNFHPFAWHEPAASTQIPQPSPSGPEQL